MKALVAPDHETAFQSYEQIVAAKGVDPHLSHLQRRVEAAYSRYWQHRSVLERLSPLPELTPDDRSLLKELYAPRARAVKPLKELMATIRARQDSNVQAVCQYCGLGEPNTFDHYLPKSEFHEFSVCSFNLVLCCGICNGRRGERAWCCDGERSSLHLYFDDIDDRERCLQASVVECEGSFRVSYSVGQKSGGSFARRYRRHCETLGLLERWGARATGYLDVIRAELEPWREQGPERIARHYSQMAAARTQVLGANNWEVALYHAVSRAQDFIVDALNRELRHD